MILITLLCYISVNGHYFTHHQLLELEDIVRESKIAAIEVYILSSMNFRLVDLFYVYAYEEKKWHKICL